MTRPSRRRGERGNAIVVVAVGAVGLIAVSGLAIDGGMAAATYRHAQNAADAGALAAARQGFVDAVSVPPVADSASSLTPVASREVRHNSATPGTVTSASVGSLSGTTTLWGPSTSGGMTGQAAFAEESTTLPATSVSGGVSLGGPVSTSPVDVDVSSEKAYGTVQAWPTTPPHEGSNASAQAELGHASSAELNESGDVTCMSSSATWHSSGDTPGNPASCSGGVVPSFVGDTGTVLISPNADSDVTAANAPSSHPSIAVQNAAANITGSGTLTTSGGTVTASAGLSASASTVQSSVDVGWDPSGAVVNRATVYVSNLLASASGITSAGIIKPGFSVSAPTLWMSVAVSMSTTDSHPQVTAQCSPVPVVITNLVNSVVTNGSFQPDCTVNAPLPSNADTTITGPWYSPGSDWATDCTASGAGWSCSVQACMLRIVQSDTSTTVCLLQTMVSFGIVPITTVVTANAGAVSVTASIAQPTYFMRVLGWNQTNPTATSTAAVESVVDESPTAFATSPFGMPVDALEMDSPYVYAGLQVGHEYYLYGSSMSSYNPVAGMPSGWRGQLDSTSDHRVGKRVTGSTGTATPAYYPGTSYYLEPVFDPASLTILYYAEFLPVSGHPNWGLLVNSIPLQGGAIVAADGSGLAWTTLIPGAVTLKVVS
jgi:Flp pilus assembly protein TadG